jgi:hypothetical protein
MIVAKVAGMAIILTLLILVMKLGHRQFKLKAQEPLARESA